MEFSPREFEIDKYVGGTNKNQGKLHEMTGKIDSVTEISGEEVRFSK